MEKKGSRDHLFEMVDSEGKIDLKELKNFNSARTTQNELI